MASAFQKYMGNVLNLKPGELRPVLHFWLFYGILVMMLQMGENLTMSMFIKRVGVTHLPTLYIWVAVLNMAFTTLYTFVADRLGNRQIFITALLWSGLGFLLTYALAPVLGEITYYLFFILRETSFAILIMHFGLYVRDFYSRQDSERTFPVIYASGRVGGILAGILISSLVPLIGTQNLTLLYAMLALVCIGLIFKLESVLPPSHQATRKPQEPVEGQSALQTSWLNFTEGLKFSLRSELLMAMSAATALFVLLRYFLNFEYSSAFNQAFESEDELTQFLGAYSIVALSIATVIQLVFTSRLVQGIGIAAVNQLFSVFMGLSFVGLLVWPGLNSALLARFVESELRMSFRNPVMNLFYNGVPDHMRARARAFTFGFVLPLATLAAGSTLQIIRFSWTLSAVAWLGLALSLLFIYFTWRQGVAYRTSMAALESGRVRRD